MMAYEVFCEGLLGFGKCTTVGREEDSTVKSTQIGSCKYLIRPKTTQIKIRFIIHFPNYPNSCCVFPFKSLYFPSAECLKAFLTLDTGHPYL